MYVNPSRDVWYHWTIEAGTAEALTAIVTASYGIASAQMGDNYHLLYMYHVHVFNPFRCSHKSISDMLASYQGNQVIKSPHYLEIFNL